MSFNHLFQNATYLNKTSILDAIAHLLPVRMEPILLPVIIPSQSPVPPETVQLYPELGDDISTPTDVPPAQAEDSSKVERPDVDARGGTEELISENVVKTDVSAPSSNVVSHSLLDLDSDDKTELNDGKDKPTFEDKALIGASIIPEPSQPRGDDYVPSEEQT